MQVLNNIVCIEGSEFLSIIPKGTFDALVNRKKINRLQPGGNGRQALFEFDTLPDLYKQMVIEKLGDPYEVTGKQPIKNLIKPDTQAIEFFDKFRFENGKPLPHDKEKDYRRWYSNDASILNAFSVLLSDKKELKARLNISLGQFWANAGAIITDVSRQLPNTLPTSDRRLKPKYAAYKELGYISLIDPRFCNQNRRKVTESLEELIHSIFIMNNKPYSKDVWALFKRFMAGEIEVLKDDATGEVYDRTAFVKDGEPIDICESTVYNYINMPMNRIVVDRLRLSALEFSSKRKPHMNRHAPVYAFSKITMDDISLPFKLENGDRPWSYQVFDVASGCVIGKTFGKDKDRGLFMAAINDLFRLILNMGWGVPGEIEIEQHISNTFADDLLKEGNVFPFVRFCRGGNPQEKRAEGMINGKKYQLQNKRDGFQRRPFARYEGNRQNEDKNKVRYTYEEIIANEEADIQTWNHSLHPKQDKYPGLTRWQVLCNNQNPNLAKPEMYSAAFYIGKCVSTSINRSQYVQVQYKKYALPHISVMQGLKDLEVTAYYIPALDGHIKEVHLYQNDRFICTCQELTAYNESKYEQTAEDRQIMAKQFEYVEGFNKDVKERVGRLSKVKIIDNTAIESVVYAAETAIIQQEIPEKVQKSAVKMPDYDTNDAEYWAKKAIEDL